MTVSAARRVSPAPSSKTRPAPLPTRAAQPVPPDTSTKEGKALFTKPGVSQPPTPDDAQVRLRMGITDFFSRLLTARLAEDPDARAAAELLRRGAPSTAAEERRRARKQRTRRLSQYGRQP